MEAASTIKRQLFTAQNWWRSKTLTLIRFFTHPVTVFVVLQAICVTIAVIWVVWFVDQNEAIEEVNSTFSQFQWDMSFGLTLLIVGCVLLGMLIVGTIFLFVFAQKQSNLIRTQKNFVSSVTHELRSPLSSIQLVFETLSSRDVPDAVKKEMYRMAGRDIERLSRLVEQILLSGRLDRGLHGNDEIEAFSLADIFSEAIDRADHLPGDVHARVQVKSDAPYTLTGQRSVFRLIVSNLIENALKYSDKSLPVEVKVKGEERDVLITIKDLGLGLSRKDIRKIFRMFHRSKIATKKAISGTGLGLYIVKTLVGNLGGKVWVESPGYGQGSTFYLRVPKDMSPEIRRNARG